MVVLERLDWFLAVLVLAGFAVALWGQGVPMSVRISELSDGPSRLVVLTGQVRWAEGSRLQLCQGMDCVWVRTARPAESGWKGRSVAVQGRYSSGTLWADAGGVDVLG